MSRETRMYGPPAPDFGELTATVVALGMPRGLKPTEIDPLSIPSTPETSITLERYRTLIHRGNPRLLPFLRSKKFVNYINDIGNPGPVTDRLLSAAETGDNSTFLFGARHAPEMKKIDDTFHKFMVADTDSEVTISAKTLFVERFEDIWNTITDTTDLSKWRQFVLAHFPAVYATALDTTDSQEYVKNSQKEYDRMKAFVEESRPEDFKQLATYLHDSREAKNGVGVMQEFDEEVRAGDFDRFYTYRSVRDRMNEKEKRLDGKENAEKYWFNQFRKGIVTFDTFLQIPQTLSGFNQATDSLIDGLPADHPLVNHINQLRRHAAMAESPEVMIKLLSDGILPTDPIITFLQTAGDEGRTQLVRLQQETREGRFDHANMLQRELEYPTYLKFAGKTSHRTSRHDFENLPFLGELDQVPELSQIQTKEAKAAAYEAAGLYWKVNEGVKQNRDAIVIGNHRYGSKFITDPLRPHLDTIGVTVLERRIPSTTARSNVVPGKIFDNETIATFAQGNNDIWIADGTQVALDHRLGIARMPAAFFGYLNWFLAFNEAVGYTDPTFENNLRQLRRNQEFVQLVQHIRSFRPTTPYDIRMWTPLADQEKNQVTIDGVPFSYHEPDFTSPRPQIILANPIIIPHRIPHFPDDLESHVAAYFDNPDIHVERGNNIVFTRFGVENPPVGKTEAQLIQQVQTTMSANMEEMIALTAPIS